MRVKVLFLGNRNDIYCYDFGSGPNSITPGTITVNTVFYVLPNLGIDNDTLLQCQPCRCFDPYAIKAKNYLSVYTFGFYEVGYHRNHPVVN